MGKESAGRVTFKESRGMILLKSAREELDLKLRVTIYSEGIACKRSARLLSEGDIVSRKSLSNKFF